MGGDKEQGLCVHKHADGNLWPILDMIIGSGIKYGNGFPGKPHGLVFQHPDK